MSRAVFLGTPEVALPSLRALVRTVEVAAVITRPDRPRGRSGRPVPPAVKQAASDMELPVLQPANAAELSETVASLGPLDVGVVVAFGVLLRPEILALPAKGFINIHFSLLPRWRGAAPVPRAILAGDDLTGVTLMRLDEGMDTGPVLAATATRIGADETGGELTRRLARRGAGLLADVLPPLLSAELLAAPQDDGEATYAPVLRAEDRHLDPEQPAVGLVRRVRALFPRPGAFGLVAGRRLKVLTAREHPGAGLEPGEIDQRGDELLLGTGEGSVVLDLVQPEGKEPMAATAWWRGLRTDRARLERPDR